MTLKAGVEGAVPSEGPLTKTFKPGSRELPIIRAEYVREQTIHMCGHRIQNEL